MLFAAISGVLTQTQGTITSPANGTHIAPGAAFDFLYNARGDYCISSYNYTVWLLTSSPSTIGLYSNSMTGHYFGRFSDANSGECHEVASVVLSLRELLFIANPNPANPPPAQLVMPDFSISPGGFGVGATAQDATFYFAVMEEWATCAVRWHFNDVFPGTHASLRQPWVQVSMWPLTRLYIMRRRDERNTELQLRHCRGLGVVLTYF